MLTDSKCPCNDGCHLAIKDAGESSPLCDSPCLIYYDWLHGYNYMGEDALYFVRGMRGMALRAEDLPEM